MTPSLNKELQEALDANKGFIQGPTFVAMSIDMYREMMGVGSEEEYRASLHAIEEGVQDVENDRTQSVEEFFTEFDHRHGIQD